LSYSQSSVRSDPRSCAYGQRAHRSISYRVTCHIYSHQSDLIRAPVRIARYHTVLIARIFVSEDAKHDHIHSFIFTLRYHTFLNSEIVLLKQFDIPKYRFSCVRSKFGKKYAALSQSFKHKFDDG